MKFSKFEQIVSQKRLSRYLAACDNNKTKALTLYRYNLQLSEALYSVVSCFEVALRNAINEKLCSLLGSDWLRDSIKDNGVFSLPILQNK
jgi:PIN domain nuclease of toxin-antitoxin system